MRRRRNPAAVAQGLGSSEVGELVRSAARVFQTKYGGQAVGWAQDNVTMAQRGSAKQRFWLRVVRELKDRMYLNNPKRRSKSRRGTNAILSSLAREGLLDLSKGVRTGRLKVRGIKYAGAVRGSRRNPNLGNDPSIFVKRAAQSMMAQKTGIPLARLKERFGDDFDPVQILGRAAIELAAQGQKQAATEVKVMAAQVQVGTAAKAGAYEPAPAQPRAEVKHYTRDETIARIRAGLKKRSGKAWSVTGGHGTAWGWIHINTPPKRRIYNWDGTQLENGKFGYMSAAERQELAELLGMDKPIHAQGEQVAASSKHYQEYVDRAEGREPSVTGEQYWD